MQAEQPASRVSEHQRAANDEGGDGEVMGDAVASHDASSEVTSDEDELMKVK